MTFNPNIPTINDKILQSYFQLRANFQTINAAFAENHASLTQDPSVAGMHTVLEFQPVNSDPTTSASEIALYNKLVSSVPELFFRPSSDQTPIQMTYPSLQTGLQSENPDVYFPTQYSFIAGPFIVYGGVLTAITNGQNVTLTPGTNLLYVDCTIKKTNHSFLFGVNVIPINIAGTTFTLKFEALKAGESIDIYYLAIGM